MSSGYMKLGIDCNTKLLLQKNFNVMISPE